MTDCEYARTLDELDRLLNDVSIPMQPERIWALLAQVSRKSSSGGSASDTSRPNH
jgi:hypothetical protein